MSRRRAGGGVRSPARRGSSTRGEGHGGLSRLIMPALLVVASYYAVFGGEYSVFELRRARVDLQAEQAALQDLGQSIDSLSAWADSLRSDPATLERIARERFGMIREGETLYRFVPAEGDEVESN